MQFDQAADSHQQIALIAEVKDAAEHNLVFKFCYVLLKCFVLDFACN